MITVKRESELEIRTWSFRYDDRDHALRPLWYTRETRETRRHKFRVQVSWDHAFNRNAQITVPADVLSEARAEFVETLKVSA